MDGTPSEQVQQLFLTHASLCRGYILGLLPNESLADDVFQEVFLVVIRKADTWQPGTNFLAWVRAIAKIKVLEACRAQRRTGSMLSPEVLELLADSAPDPGEEQLEEKKQGLRGCLAKLTDRARKLIELRYLERLSAQEMADRLAIKIGSVNVMLSRTRDALRICAEKWLAGQDLHA